MSSRSIKRSISPPRNTIKIITANNNDDIKSDKDFKDTELNNNNTISTTNNTKNTNNNNNNNNRELPLDQQQTEWLNEAIKELSLKPWQIEWAQKAINILMNNKFYIDTSPMRSGKTFVCLYLALFFDLEIFVICPTTITEYWAEMCELYGVKMFTHPVSYEALVRGTKNEVVNLYLTKKTIKKVVKDSVIEDVQFSVTKMYTKELATRKILLILDEAQMTKNDCQAHAACNALIKPIITSAGLSRFGLLSGTLIDKPEQIINLFRTIGYIRAPELFYTTKGSKTLNLTGVDELMAVCEQIDPSGTQKLRHKMPTSYTINAKGKAKEDVENFCFTVYTDIIKPKVSGAMSAPDTAKGVLYVKNGYYHIHPQKTAELKSALSELKNRSGYSTISKRSAASSGDEEREDEIKKKNKGKYNMTLVQIEKSKLYDMARVASKILSEDPTNKVVITINYTGDKTRNLEELLEYLGEYDPLIITGKTATNKRSNIINQFNTNQTKRLLIANPKPISVGISLVGDGKRFMLVSPSPKLMEIVQLSARLYSDKLMTDSHVMIFYGIIDGISEANIMEFIGTKKGKGKGKKNEIDSNIKEILEKKSDVLGRMQEIEIRKNMKLPSDYEDIYEDEKDVIY
jgi:hypothetical protein